MSQRGQTSIKRPWVTALVAIVAVVSAAALVHAIARERSAVPTAAPSSSSPAPASSYVKDDKQTTCDKIDAARRDFLTVLEQANPVLDNPDSTPAEIQEQADKLLTALEALDPLEKRCPFVRGIEPLLPASIELFFDRLWQAPRTEEDI